MSGRRDTEPTIEGALDIFPVPVRNPILTTTPPAPRTSFIGRDQELHNVHELLAQAGVRLVTLTGPGGVGKSRLAIEILAGIRLPIHFVNLTDVPQSELVLSTISTVLGLNSAGRPILEGLAAGLREDERLLVLDNFEHVLPAASDLAGLLDACPRLTILVTSRAVLGIPGERVVDLQPFPLPAIRGRAPEEQASRFEVCRLFVERAQAIAPEFVLTPGNAQTIVDICRRLDGLPLAVELAATWISVLSPAALLAQLEQCLALTDGDAVRSGSRQRTLRDTIAWSYSLLGATAQTLFRRLAVFNSGCTLDACMTVCGDFTGSVLNELRTLVANSLVRRVDRPGEESRYVMLETVRDFGIDQLNASDEADDIRQRHANYVLSLARQIEEQMYTPQRLHWLDRLGAEAGNLQGALNWAIETENAELALDLFGTLLPYWQFHFQSSVGRELAKRTRAISREVSAPVLRKALFSAGTLDYMQGDVDQAKANLTDARRRFLEAGDHVMAARSKLALGRIAWDQGDLETARRWFDAAIRRFELSGDRAGLAQSLHYLGLVSWTSGNLARAAAELHEALQIWESLGFEWELACCIPGHLADIARDAGNHAKAVAGYKECLAINWARHDSENISWSLAGLATMAVLNEKIDTAVRLMALADYFRDITGAPLTPHIDRDNKRTSAMVIERAGAACYAAARSAIDESELAEEIASALAWARDETGDEPAKASDIKLTQRELDVLRLIAAGKSNQEIADILFLSHGTVKVHVTHILSKLDVRSRSAATDYAHRHNLA